MIDDGNRLVALAEQQVFNLDPTPQP